MRKLLITIGLITGAGSLFAAPIHDAARNGDIEYIMEYIEAGGDVNLKSETNGDFKGSTPLGYAAEFEKNLAARYLIRNGADLNAVHGGGPVWRFLVMNHKNLRVMIENGFDPNSLTSDRKTPLFFVPDAESAQLLIDNGADVNAKSITNYTPLGFNRYEAVIELLLKYGAEYQNFENETVHKIISYLSRELASLKQQIEQGSTSNANPTDEWPRKMWEIELEYDFGSPNQGEDFFTEDIIGLRQSSDGAVIFAIETSLSEFQPYWVSNKGELSKIGDDAIEGRHSNKWANIVYFDSTNLIYLSHQDGDGNVGVLRKNEYLKVTKLTRNKNSIKTSIFKSYKFALRSFSINAGGEMNDGYDQSSKFQTIQLTLEGSKVTAWDFTPPTLASTDNEGGNNGGNTAMSRLSIGTSGPDISIATDGKLGGPAELQKSNDLKNWRKLGDVPADSTELLITPRDSGNEFFRLKRVGE